jgi:hypothetical protein
MDQQLKDLRNEWEIAGIFLLVLGINKLAVLIPDQYLLLR